MLKTMEPMELAASRDYCRLMVRRARSSFTPSFLLLDAPRRRAMEALYAFLRYTDDLGDDQQPLPARRTALAQWQTAVHDALGDRRERSSSSPAERNILPALVDSVRRYRVPPECLEAVLEGVRWDLEGRQYGTFEDLSAYCERVASAVGVACIHVWGFRGEAALEPARRCGIAFQVTNILRDLKEDAARERVYLPSTDLAACGYSAEELRRGTVNEAFHRLITLEVGRARQLFHDGAGLFEFLAPGSRRIFGMMLATYYRLLEEIDRHRDRLFERRVRLARSTKLLTAARWFLLPPRRSALP